MKSILDQIAQSQRFIPATVEHYLALRLAKGLNDEQAILRYVHYLAHFTTEHLLSLYDKALTTKDPAGEFHSSLTRQP